MKRAIIIGSSGQVAKSFFDELQMQKIPYISTSSSGKQANYVLDLAKEDSVKNFFAQAHEKGELEGAEVFLVGALTHVDKCENERQLCQAINEFGPAYVAKECSKYKIPLTFFSTEYVFGGEEAVNGKIGPFSEEDKPSPQSWYGQCKLNAENKIQEILNGTALIIRTTIVFSWDTQGLNFFMQLFRHLTRLNNGEPSQVFKIPNDQISTPTYAPFLAGTVLKLRAKNATGIFNVVGQSVLGRDAFVADVIDFFSFDKDKCAKGFEFFKTSELNQVAKRPLSAGLSVEKIKKLGIEAPTFRQALQEIKKLIGKS